MLVREEPNDPVSPGFHPGLCVKRTPGPEGRGSTSGRRHAERKRPGIVFRVKQRPRTSVRGFVWDGAGPVELAIQPAAHDNLIL